MLAVDPKVQYCVRFITTYLLITDSELALSLLVLIGESLEFLDGLRLQDLDAEFDIALRVLVTWLWSS